jgi:hypothetical protein
MTAKFPCPAKATLMIAYQNATKVHAESVGKLGQIIDLVSRDEYDSLRLVSEKAHRLSLTALEALDAHTEEHGC